jgi:peptidyl-tRNA hydrolase
VKVVNKGDPHYVRKHLNIYIKLTKKIVLLLFQQVPDESDLLNLESKLKENNILHKMWTEQPENFPTCIVVKPYRKEEVQKYFKKLKLFKG